VASPAQDQEPSEARNANHVQNSRKNGQSGDTKTQNSENVHIGYVQRLDHDAIKCGAGNMNRLVKVSRL
jgi:hypothetical protein